MLQIMKITAAIGEEFGWIPRLGNFRLQPKTSQMSRRILIQPLRRTLWTSRTSSLISKRSHVPISLYRTQQLSPVSRFSTCSPRFHANDDSKGVPLKFGEHEIHITPDEQERLELQQQAQ